MSEPQPSQSIEVEFEALRAPLLNLRDAAVRAGQAAESLEWALWATDPKIDHGNFNHAYAKEQRAEAEPEFRAALDELRHVLETGIERLIDP